jgi:hypothetical protein
MLYTVSANVKLHWNYFIALEKDMDALSRYIEFCPDNFHTYSIELAHLLLSAASEVDSVAKCICAILDPKANAQNINEYRTIIRTGEDAETDVWPFNAAPNKDVEKHRHRISAIKVYIQRYRLEFLPWGAWANNNNPDWWTSYNKVKHERNAHFNKATLHNALNALAGLLAMNYVHCRLDRTKDEDTQRSRYQFKEKNITRYMEPQSTLLRFEPKFYDDPITYLSAMTMYNMGAV